MNRYRRFFTPEYLYESNKIWDLREKILKNKKSLPNRIRYLKLFRLMKKTHCLMPMSKDINPFTTPHGLFGIYISFGAKIGKNCVIFNNVTIGSNTLEDSKGFGAPEIGDNVYIGTGAKIIGNVRIGNNVRVGANCIVTENIPDNATVVMPHPRVIHHKKRSNTYYNWAESHKKKDGKNA